MVETIYAQLPADFQNAISTTAGVVLSDFDPSGSNTAEAIQTSVLFATSGGVNVSCKYTFKDYGSDIDNCPKNTKELLDVESVECMLSGTGVTITSEAAKSMLGLADKSTEISLDTVTPRINVKTSDFADLWYVCPYGTQGGFVAIKLSNALSDGGLSMQSTDLEKGKFAFSYKGYSSINAPTVVPFTFYLKATDASKTMNVKAAPAPVKK